MNDSLNKNLRSSVTSAEKIFWKPLIFLRSAVFFIPTIPAKPSGLLTMLKSAGYFFLILIFFSKYSANYSFSQLLPKGSVLDAEPPVGLFFYISLAYLIFKAILAAAYPPGLGFSRSMPKCGGFFICGGTCV